MDLANSAKRLQKTGKLGPTYSDPDTIVTLGQNTHHMPAKKSRAAINSNQSVIRTACGHSALDLMG
jgi:hypothetical protein